MFPFSLKSKMPDILPLPSSTQQDLQCPEILAEQITAFYILRRTELSHAGRALPFPPCPVCCQQSISEVSWCPLRSPLFKYGSFTQEDRNPAVLLYACGVLINQIQCGMKFLEF